MVPEECGRKETMKTSINSIRSAGSKNRWLARFSPTTTPAIPLLIVAAIVLVITTMRHGAFAQAVNRSSTAAALNLDWPYYGNDLGNSRYQDVDQINPSNVARLKPAWIFHTGVLDPDASLEVSPIMVNGTLYLTSGHDDVFALDAATGQEKWAYRPLAEDMTPLEQLTICCGQANRGVAVGNGKVFIGRLDDVLVALDANTGAVLWKSTVVDFHDNFSITMATQFVNNLVIVGVSGGEFQVRGQVVAYNAETGAEVWRFFTTAKGTWGGDSWKHGGATLWNTPAVDPALGLIYINTGNPSPDLNGVRRIGQNLYATSIVALDLSTGHVRWFFQEVHHDLWDYDSAQPVLLFTLEKNGQTFPALGHCGKNGNYYILDRRNGQPLFDVDELPVPTKPAWQHPWPTQPVSSVEPLTPLGFVPGTIDLNKLPPGVTLAPQYTPPSRDTVLISPGDDGGAEWPPAGFSPRTKFIYYGTRYEPSTFVTAPNNTEGIGSAFEEKVPGVKAFGIFGATDTATGKTAWKIHVRQPAKSGLLVAGDLVFFGEGNGKFHAVDAVTGAILWTFNGG